MYCTLGKFCDTAPMIKGTKNGKSRLVAVRLPHELADALEAKARADGLPLARALIMAAWRGLGLFTISAEERASNQPPK